MKNKIKLLVLAFVMLVVAVPSMTAKAAGEEVWQTGITANSGTIQWTNYGAGINFQGQVIPIEGYAINKISLNGQLVNQVTVPKTQTSYTFTGMLSGQPIIAQVGAIVDINGEKKLYPLYGAGEIKGDDYGILVWPKPLKVTGVNYYKYSSFGGFEKEAKLSLEWKQDGYLEGYEATLYNKSGKAIQTIDTGMKLGGLFSKTNSKNVYKVKVRSYVTLTKGQKVYGDYSDTFYAVPQPKITCNNNKDIAQYSYNCRWKKIKGATEYTIYGSKKEKSGFKKIATVKGNKSSYKVTKIKGKSLNTMNTYYYFKIVTTAKFGKKKVKSKSDTQLRIHSYRVYR